MRKAEKHEDVANMNHDDDDENEEYDEREDCVYEDKKCKMADATSRYQLNCITFSIKDFKYAIYLVKGTSCDM